MLKLLTGAILFTGAICAMAGQQAPDQKAPQVRVNVINVCTPSAEDQKAIAEALARIPVKPHWAEDFEVDRGRTTVPQDSALGLPRATGAAPVTGSAATVSSTWARIRREFRPDSPFLNAQYSFSMDSQNMVETLVLRPRDSKDVLQISIEDSVTAATSPASVLATDTPARRIRLERFGKGSVVLARCSQAETGHAVDQSAYEPLFASASAVLANYRDALGARHTIPAELARIANTAIPSKSARKASRQRH